MAVKASGAEFKAFYFDPSYWIGQTFHEEEEIYVNGGDPPEDFNDIPDNAKVSVSGGIVFIEGKSDREAPSLESYFRRWRKARSTTTLIVEIDRDKEVALREAIKSASGRIVS